MSNVKITAAHIDDLFANSHLKSTQLGFKTTVVCLTLPNGFEIVESASCVDPANYNHETGVDICKKRLKERLWLLEGYALQYRLVRSASDTKLAEALREAASADIYTDAPECQEAVQAHHTAMEDAALRLRAPLL